MIIHYSHLEKIIEVAAKEDLRGKDALCIDMAKGSSEAGRMLMVLIYLLQKNEYGTEYMTHSKWWDELRIHSSKVPKLLDALVTAGVDIEDAGSTVDSPVIGYSINLYRFVHRVEEVTGVPGKQVLAILREPGVTDEFI